jgi:hypothetical protein
MAVPHSVVNPREAFEYLHSQLNRAILSSIDPVGSEIMRQADAVIVEAITMLNRPDYRARATQLKELSVSLNGHLVTLAELKESLETIVDDSEVVYSVSSAIDVAVFAAAQAFPIV